MFRVFRVVGTFLWVISFPIQCWAVTPKCPLRIKYLHVQEMSQNYMQIGSNISSLLKPALQNISTQFPGSTFGIWRMQDKQNSALYCGEQDLAMTKDLNAVNAAIDSWEAMDTPTHGGGSTADELLMYLSSAPEVWWEAGDDGGDDPAVRVVKVIGIATGDGTFYYGDGISTNMMSAYSPEYAIYGRGYHPQDPSKCHTSGYPELGIVSRTIVEKDVYPLIVAPNAKVSTAFDSSQPPVQQWWAQHFSSESLNIADRGTVAVVIDSFQLTEAIIDAAAKGPCATTTTTVTVNCDVRLQYVQVLHRQPAYYNVVYNLYPVGENLTSAYPGSMVGLWSTLPRTMGSIYLELPLTTNGSQLSAALNTTLARSDWDQHIGAAFTDAFWYAPLIQETGWETANKSLWPTPSIKILSIVADDGDWWAEDGNPTNDGNGYDPPSIVFPDGSYDPRNQTQRTMVSNQQQKLIRDSIIDNDVYVIVTARTGVMYAGFDQSQTVLQWWTSFFEDTLQIPDRFQICQASEDFTNIGDCVYNMTKILQATVCNHDVSTTTPTPPPPTTTPTPPPPCSVRFQIIVSMEDNTHFIPGLQELKNQLRYLAKNVLGRYPGSSFGIEAEESKSFKCLTSIFPQTDNLTELLADIDSWELGGPQDEVYGRYVSEMLWHSALTKKWDVKINTPDESIPKLNVFLMVTNDGTFFHDDGTLHNEHDMFGLPFDENPYGAYGPYGYDPSNVTMCSSTAYPNMLAAANVVQKNDLFVHVSHCGETDNFYSHDWNVDGQSAKSSEWWAGTFANLGVDANHFLWQYGGYYGTSNLMGEYVSQALDNYAAFACSSTTTTPQLNCPSQMDFVHLMRRATQISDANPVIQELGVDIATAYPGSTVGLWSSTPKASNYSSYMHLALTSDYDQFGTAVDEVISDAPWTSDMPSNALLELVYYVANASQTGWATDNPLKIISIIATDAEYFYNDGCSTNDATFFDLPYIAYPNQAFDPTILTMKMNSSYPGVQSLNESIILTDVYFVVAALNDTNIEIAGDSIVIYDWWVDFLTNRVMLPSDRFRVCGINSTYVGVPDCMLSSISDIRSKKGC